MQLTAVSMVIVEGDATHLLAEMSDSSVITLSFPWGIPKMSTYYNKGFGDLLYQTEQKMRSLAQDYNSNRRSQVNYNLHQSKVAQLGHDYALRGY